MKHNQGNWLVENFMNKVKFFEEGKCWEWAAAKNRKGYGQYRIKGVLKIAHRVSDEWVSGPIPRDIQILHKCDNPSCVNPEHLFRGTNEDNYKDKMAKGRQANIGKKFCPQGHPYDLVNTYTKPNGHRVCRICQRENWRRRYNKTRRKLYGEDNIDRL